MGEHNELGSSGVVAGRPRVSLGRRCLALLLALVFPTGTGLLILGRYVAAGLWHAALIAGFVATLVHVVGGFMTVLVAGVGSVVHTLIAGAPATGSPSFRKGIVPFVALLAAFITIRIVTRTFVCEPFQVPSSAMSPTLIQGDHFIASKLPHEWARGEVIVFTPPEFPDKTFIMRVVALAGDAVAIRDADLQVNGRVVTAGQAKACGDEFATIPEVTYACESFEELRTGSSPYRVIWGRGPNPSLDFPSDGVNCPSGTRLKDRSCVVDSGHVFVLGDFRDNAYDSRSWGALPIANIKGRAIGIHLSLDGWKPRLERMGTDLR